jgi:hypothetical protein
MTTKQEMINLLKLNFPILKVGGDDVGYTELSLEEYETTISEWADARLEKEAKQAEAEARATAKAALLAQLGITEEQAKLLLS